MRWSGKIIGGLIGLAAGPAGAALGVLLGHGYDLSQQRTDRGVAAPGDAATIRAALFRTAFAVMGHLAKADGRVTEAEIDAARSMMRSLHLDALHVRLAIECFTRGKEADYPVEAELARLRALCGPGHELLRVFLEVQVRAALAGNDLEGPVRGLLFGIAGRLGFSALEVAQLEAALRIQRAGGGSAAAPPPGARLASAYMLFGIAATASDDDVKKAYRRQMSENHPDKLVARGLPESMQDLAKEKTQRIREAYEVICGHRGLR